MLDVILIWLIFPTPAGTLSYSASLSSGTMLCRFSHATILLLFLWNHQCFITKRSWDNDYGALADFMLTWESGSDSVNCFSSVQQHSGSMEAESIVKAFHIWKIVDQTWWVSTLNRTGSSCKEWDILFFRSSKWPSPALGGIQGSSEQA